MLFRSGNSTLVYTSSGGRVCPKCGHPVRGCRCSKQRAAVVKGDGRVRVQRQSKGRKGKGVSLITGLPLPDPELRALAKQIKQACGCGGTVKDGVIEIQGDNRDLIVEQLIRHGYDAKKAGG